MKNPRRLAALITVALICAACGSSVPALSSAAPALCSQSTITVTRDRFDESVSLLSTPSGVAYGDIRAGCGALAVPGKRLTVAYSFWLPNGQLVATSAAQGAGPGTFTYGKGQPFPGFDFGFANMRVGGKRRIVIPPALAFGPQGLPPTIPPNATLIVDAQLLRVSQPATP